MASDRRSPALPEVPTLAESGLPGFSSDFILVVVAPAGTPKAIVDLLNAQMVRILKLPDVRERLTTLGFEPVGSTPDELAAKIKSETEKWGKVVREANIKID